MKGDDIVCAHRNMRRTTLGSKSPLAYQDSFEIITRFNGTEYHYILANELPISQATLMTQEQTDKGNGTTIRVAIKDGDIGKISEACKTQLVYFNNVYVKNEFRFYDNDFKIYDSNNYKLRNGTFPYNMQMHIVLGQVAYPINWNVIGVEPINIPVGLKFEIGELEVDLSRENVQYTENVKTKVKAKIELVSEEILNMYENQIQITDLFEYANLVHNRQKPPLKIRDVTIPMTNIKASIRFAPLNGLKINYKNIESLFSLYKIITIQNGKLSDTFDNNYISLFKYPSSFYLLYDKLNYWDTKYINEGRVLKRIKINSKTFTKLALLLNLVENVKDINSYRLKAIYKQGTFKKVYQLIKYVDDYLKNHIKKYDNIAPNYWIEEKKEEQRNYQEGRKDLITYYDIYNHRKQVKLGGLLDNYKVIFYISKNEKKELLVAYFMLYHSTNDYFKKNAQFIIVSDSVTSKFKKHKNQMFEAPMMFQVKMFRNLLHRMYLSKRLREDKSVDKENFKFSTYYNEIYNNLAKTYNENYFIYVRGVPDEHKNVRTYEIDLCEIFNEQIKNNKLTKNRTALIYEENLEELLKASKKLSICRYITNDIPHAKLVELLSFYKVLKLDGKYYDKNYINP